MRTPKPKPGGVWKFIPDEPKTPEEIQSEQEERIDTMLAGQVAMTDPKDFAARCAIVESRQDYFPGTNQVEENGSWILIKTPPPTEYTVPPLSIWFSEPWPQGELHRVKIVTPRGELGVYPREYTKLDSPSKYLEFIGEGMEAKFFGSEDGIPKDKLFYLRSRGISKKDAIIMLIGEIKAHGVMWIESTRETVATFGMKFPDDHRNATL